MTMYKNKKILVIGGTGTIGNHLVRRLLQDDPKVIRVFSRDEYKQYVMCQELDDCQSKLRFLIGDVRDQERLVRAMEGIDYVFHLAAMKHVPACEYNPFEAVKTNVIGTQNVIQSAITTGVQRVLFTSSDKAISPTNTYGATKLTAERLISAAEYHKGPKSTIFSSVRFGNVMGSRGSVIPLFKKQILEQGYVTVTNAQMTRYMMTPSQAISLILKANEMAKGGEVFVLKMPVVLLRDLVEVLIEEVSKKYNINKQIEVREVGLRPGEKMYEELMTADEASISFETDEMFIIPHISKYKNNSRLKENGILSKNREAITKSILKNWLINEKLF